MFFLVAKFFQFKGVTTSTKDLFEKKKTIFSKFRIHIINFLQLIVIGIYNIEGFKQAFNFTTCLWPNVVKSAYG